MVFMENERTHHFRKRKRVLKIFILFFFKYSNLLEDTISKVPYSEQIKSRIMRNPHRIHILYSRIY